MSAGRRRSRLERRNACGSAAWAALVTGIGIALLSPPGCTTDRGQSGRSDEDAEAAAVLDGDEITLEEVDDRIRHQLFEEEFGRDADRLYAARQATLDDMIDERLLDRAASAAGQPPETYLEEAVAALPPIAEADLQRLFDSVRDRLPAEATIDAYRDQLRAHLESERREQVFAALREGKSIEVTLPRERVSVDATGPSLGAADAPVTVVEFSDFQCPYCGRAVATVKALHQRYPDRIRIVYRHLPLSFHGQARLAAVASVCADAQGRFWDYHDLLFAHQQALGRDDLIGYANTLGLDRDAFEACLDSSEATEKVVADLQAAEDAGATGTPTFFVNGIKLTGARPLDQFEALIDDELARVAP